MLAKFYEAFYLYLFIADKEARTKGEKQTPVHFAARNDACNSLRALIRAGCEYKNVRDYKGRTPIHVAAELGKKRGRRIAYGKGKKDMHT